MGRNCIGRFGYGPKLTWAEIVMGRNVQRPAHTVILGMQTATIILGIQTLVHICYTVRLSQLGIHDIWSKTISSKRRLVECDIWSIRRFADYDISPTTTIGRKFVELRRNYVEIWSKTDLYGKIKIVYMYGSHIANIFSRQCQY